MEPPSQQHVHIQKELWRIQDVMEALNKQKAQRDFGDNSGVNFCKHKNEVSCWQICLDFYWWTLNLKEVVATH